MLNIKSLFKTNLKLTEDEGKIEVVIKQLLSKEDTDIEDDYSSNSFLLANKRLDTYIEVNGSVMVQSDNNTNSKQLRLTVVEHYKDLIQQEKSRRFKETKNVIFKNSLDLLDRIKENLEKQ